MKLVSPPYESRHLFEHLATQPVPELTEFLLKSPTAERCPKSNLVRLIDTLKSIGQLIGTELARHEMLAVFESERQSPHIIKKRISNQIIDVLKVRKVVAALCIARYDSATSEVSPRTPTPPSCSPAHAPHLTISAEVVPFPECDSPFVLILDPLEGLEDTLSVNGPVGCIFSVYHRLGNPFEPHDFLQPGREQIAAGYFLYSRSTVMVLSLGRNVNAFTLASSLGGAFFLSHPNIESLRGRVMRPQVTVDLECLPSWFRQFFEKGSGGKCILRRTGCLVADFHRLLLKGGILLCPPEGSETSSLIFHCNPLSFIAEKAGGMALNTKGENILDLEPKKLDQKTLLICGNFLLIKDLHNFT